MSAVADLVLLPDAAPYQTYTLSGWVLLPNGEWEDRYWTMTADEAHNLIFAERVSPFITAQALIDHGTPATERTHP